MTIEINSCYECDPITAGRTIAPIVPDGTTYKCTCGNTYIVPTPMKNNDIKCPNCKSENTKLIEKGDYSNPVIGQPVTIIDSYYSCRECGVRFDKVAKKEQIEVFSRDECVFNYCPHPELCKDKCITK